MNLPNSNKGFAPVVVLIIVVLVALAGVAIAAIIKPDLFRNVPGLSALSSNSTGTVATTEATPAPKPTTPYGMLEEAINKTNATKTAYVEFSNKVDTRVSSTKSGLTTTIKSSVDGYMTGSTTGDVQKAELRISNMENPSASIALEMIQLENGDLYVKGPATNGKWSHMTKAEQEATSGKTPVDASLFGFDILGTIFSKEKALLSAIKEDSVTKLQDETKDGKTFSVYKVEVSILDFANAYSKDPEVTEKKRKEIETILADATLDVTFKVDQASGYVSNLYFEAKNLKQVSTPEAEQLGVSSVHDMTMDATLSRFDVPTAITAPDPMDVIKTGTNI